MTDPIESERRYQTGLGVCLTLLVAVIWALRHRYSGLVGDAQLYAFQALARLHPALAGDFALRNGSQDSFTLFTPAYAWVIDRLGLHAAALTGQLASTAAFLTAAWFTVRAVSNRLLAFLSVALLCIVGTAYGSANVFNYVEDYFSARSLAEALIVVSLACELHGRRLPALLMAACALAIHPLMALPGVLLLACLWVGNRIAVRCAIAGVLGTFALALTGRYAASTNPLLLVMDPAWLNVVRERSQFLFLDLWFTRDWALNARPFVSLAVTILIVAEPRIRGLSLAALLVGAAGLSVALIAGTVGPSAILVQGQAWRWVWITSLISVLLLVPTAARAWADERGGPACAVLLICAWTFDRSNGLLFLICVPILWWGRNAVTPRHGRYLRWVAFAGVAVLIAWDVIAAWSTATAAAANPEDAYPLIARLSNLFALGLPAVLFSALVVWLLLEDRAASIPGLVGAALLALLIVILPFTLHERSQVSTRAEIEEFATWTRAIPPTSTVYVPSFKDNGHFAWLTLGRSNYLSSNQSAGVVFSRPIALEVARRSTVLLPVEDPSWKILSRLRRARANADKKAPKEWRPLTAESLEQICADPLLGFVIAPESVGFDPLPHTNAGSWKGWNLYDCNRVIRNRPRVGNT